MPRKCCVTGCRQTVKDGVSFHRIPKDNRRNQWLAIIGKSEGDLDEESRVCSSHFDEEFFEYDWKVSHLPVLAYFLWQSFSTHFHKKVGTVKSPRKSKPCRNPDTSFALATPFSFYNRGLTYPFYICFVFFEFSRNFL